MNIDLNIDKNIENNDIEIKQKNFLNTNIGNIVNTAIDVGLRFILPDFIEEQVIEIKNALIEGGIKEGVNTAIEEGINFGKSTIGIITGKFDNVEQMQNAVKAGGVIDGISNVIDAIVTKQNNKGKISNKTTEIIKSGKNLLLDNISSNIENMLIDQNKMINKIEKYSKNWKKAYNNKNINEMEKEYKKIKKLLNKIAPIETIINNSRKIENLHILIKNNGNNFDITKNAEELAEIL